MHATRLLTLACLILSIILAPPSPARTDDRLTIETIADHPRFGGRVSTGFFRVPENRETRAGRELQLHFFVLHARSDQPHPDPVFFFAGGPGVDVTSSVGRSGRSWMRDDRDLVFLSQRGTGGSHRLGGDLNDAHETSLQAYLSPGFDRESARALLDQLQKNADLTQYSTFNAVDDVNEFREAMGYERINLTGGSYGSRAALIYIRQHPETVRCAMLNGIAPLAFTNPLYHAEAAQEGLDLLLDEVESDPEYRDAFPSLRERFNDLLSRLEKQPAAVTITIVGTDEQQTVLLDRQAFAEALRVMMYYMPTNREVPYLLHRACEGDVKPFALRAIESNRSIRNMIAFGMLLCVTAAEDVARIDPDMIPEVTDGTFLGDTRVRRQMAICGFWPKSKLPDDFGDPVSVDVPVLLLSGTHDPVTPPKWGDEAASHLPNSLHVVVPGAHGVSGPCVDSIMKQVLDSGRVEAIDTSCVERMRLPRLRVD